MVALDISRTAVYFTVSAGNYAIVRGGNFKVIILSFRIIAPFVELGRYGLRFIQMNIALVFFVFKSQTISSPAGKSGAFLRDGSEVNSSATISPVSFYIRHAIFLEILAAIAAAVYAADFFARIIYADYFANTAA